MTINELYQIVLSEYCDVVIRREAGEWSIELTRIDNDGDILAWGYGVANDFDRAASDAMEEYRGGDSTE